MRAHREAGALARVGLVGEDPRRREVGLERRRADVRARGVQPRGLALVLRRVVLRQLHALPRRRRRPPRLAPLRAAAARVAADGCAAAEHRAAVAHVRGDEPPLEEEDDDGDRAALDRRRLAAGVVDGVAAQRGVGALEALDQLLRELRVAARLVGRVRRRGAAAPAAPPLHPLPLADAPIELAHELVGHEVALLAVAVEHGKGRRVGVERQRVGHECAVLVDLGAVVGAGAREGAADGLAQRQLVVLGLLRANLQGRLHARRGRGRLGRVRGGGSFPQAAGRAL